MASKDPKQKAPQPPKQAKAEPSLSQVAFGEGNVVDNTPFPVPDLYFHVFDSEVDEPESRVRRDVNKLYTRWQEKYGRRWPENGMNTDDLVWLAEEAYKTPGQPNSNQALAESRRGAVELEQERYAGEFVPEPVQFPSEDEVAMPASGKRGAGPASGKGGASGTAGPKGSKRHISNYEATLAGGNWVTDEFESVDYEAGNLETLWGMHLWDYEGKTIMMPPGPVDEAAGEESEEWDDFLGSYRPRFVDTEDAREAVWATDEFESDEDNTESEWEPEYVAAGLGLVCEDPINPQYSLRHSNHPLAPFPGEPLKWASSVYDDGTTFEGLSRDAVPHGMGVMVFGNGTGGGFHFRDVRRGDKYEGEFQAGYAHGLGQMTSENRGEVYIGEFFAGQRHGCGIRINMQPYYYLLQRGEDPVTAYARTHVDIMRNIEFRTWYRNKALGSDNEDEVVLHAVRDDMDDPYRVVLRNAHHEAKLRDWAAMEDTDKVMLKMVEIIEGVGRQRVKRRGGQPLRAVLMENENGMLGDALDSYGDNTDFDSVELMVGVDDNGMPGVGWVEDTQDTDAYPLDPRLAEEVLAEVLQDKMEESDDKEAILGQDLVNPFTGLTLRDYLDGREGQHKELLERSGALRRAAQASAGIAGTADREGSSLVEVDSMPSRLQSLLDSQISRGNQAWLAKDMARSAAVYGTDNFPRNPYSEDTDTRFETDSDVMELAELAEILGTVDEAREVVTKARMWQWKPDGEVTLRFAQDGQGAPLPLMQDPLHYPHGTKFMAPGPLGQCHPIPPNEGIRAEMMRAAKNYAETYMKYNFDWDPEPGSAQYKVDQRIKRAQELRERAMDRIGDAVDEELQLDFPEPAPKAPSAPTKQSRGAPQPQMQLAALSQGQGHHPGGGGVFASLSMGAMGGLMAGYQAHAPFASLSMGMGRASKVVLDAFSKAAKQAPPRRPRIVRPSQMRRSKQASSQAAQQ